MTHYGKTFKHLRKEKGISIASAAAGVVSKSFLSRFERGLSNISFAKMVDLLVNINVSVTEFIYLDAVRNGQLPAFHYEETTDYVDNQQLTHPDSYRRQYYQTGSDHDYLNYLKAKSQARQPLSASQRQFVYDYLFGTETWTHFEGRLFMATLTLFSTDQVFILTKQMVKNGSETIDVNWNHQADFLYIILKAALIMAFAGNEKALSTLISLAHKSIHNQQYLYEKSELHFLEGFAIVFSG
ncbi:Rgg/GadR/MutR family transcriptional regulator [Lentilactobacillus kisonensis]|uniref:DNA-binding helix-turn-helix protein n=1 Tax=Lentilactobacillus kisonensis F0435 TaxID=797516 RepID=H1LFG1_9LACO|nr:Rgg/GadR/MutR family transcriptional regulator [Lentilactobacillus kisonensis]EHO51786.1 DNA-binding helix-turn-helix protein [Lentilactobacillus kisonensis F0435]